MARKKQQIVDQSVLAQPSQSRPKISSQHELVIRLVVDDVPHANELWARGKSLERALHVWSAQVYPADHSFDEPVLLRQLQEKLCFLEVVPRLNHDGAVKSCLAKL